MNKCTLSIDWEDFGQLYTKYHYKIDTAPLKAIGRQTDIILDMLEETNRKATFFILGLLAKYRPDLVKKIAAKGHEIAIHGQNHEILFTLNAKQIKEDIAESIKTVSDITGTQVFGYRAPRFSINETNLYVLQILTELDLLYDSSIFPIKLPRYGIVNFDKNDMLYKLPNEKEIVEIPLSTVKYFGKTFPVSGGGYIRVLPGFLVNKMFKKISTEKRNSIIYMHPYEFDTEKLDVTSNYPKDAKYSKLKTLALNLRWNISRNSVRNKVKQLLTNQEFITCLEKARYVKSNTISPKLLG